MEKAIIENHAYVDGSILGWKSKVGKWARLEGLCIIGEDAVISNEVYINSTIVLPNVPVKVNYPNPGSIILC